MTYREIQEAVIKEYRIDICDGTRCEDGDWSRTHAHPKKRRVCKWKQANSIQSTFDLLHEVGHIETTKGGMRRAEEEYYATVWAINECEKYGIEVPEKIIASYQRYIDMTEARGKRRGGAGYGNLNLIKPKKVVEKTKKMTFKELRQASSMTQKDFAEYFGISKRAIEEWDRGGRKCPEYLLNLMEYKLTKEGKITCTQIP